MDLSTLPIASVVEEVQLSLADHPRVVLQAAPGAGKTTGIPLALLDAPWLQGRKIVLLAPRRLAARAAAMRMADLLGEAVGQTVGYRVRMDSRVSAATRIEVVTEGILTRRLQNDPALSDTGLVIFDEFHERSLEADLGLALCLDMQGVLNPGLRLLVMSATLETEAVAALLDQAPAIACVGRQFEVETRFIGPHTPVNNPADLVRAVVKATREESGSILVFLPGAAEIRAALKQLAHAGLGPEWIIAPLFGNLTRAAQDQAIRPAPPGRRKIVLATDIAETSLTIEGIRVVVDSGLARRPLFDPRSGMTRLVTLPVSQASAEQRKGRAGRTAPGVCLRLWSQSAHAALPAEHRPEILSADLSALVLELAIWGVDDPVSLRWLNPPSPAARDGARSLLHDLGALDASNHILPHGHHIAELPLHPRLAHMVIKAAEQGLAGAACDLAAILTERDPVHFLTHCFQADLQLRFDLLQAARRNQAWHGPDVQPDQSALRRTIRTAANLYHRLRAKNGRDQRKADLGRLLAWAYPDRIAQTRGGKSGHFLLANGRGAVLEPWDNLVAEEFLVIAELDGDQRNARVFRAVAYDQDRLAQQFGEQLQWSPSIAWDVRRSMVVAQRQRKFQALTLTSEPLMEPDPRQVAAALLDGIHQAGSACLPWTKRLRQWQQRVCFLHRFATEDQPWPDLSDPWLLANLHTWLAPFLDGMSRLRHLSGIDLGAALLGLLPYALQRQLDQWAPTHLTVPSGSRVPIDYSGDVPVLAVRLQEMFGHTTTPTVAGGRQPLQIHLLSPAGRPLQITQDLEGFWRTSYHDVKRDMKGCYPKHHWPDDPLSAQPTARAKPKKQ